MLALDTARWAMRTGRSRPPKSAGRAASSGSELPEKNSTGAGVSIRRRAPAPVLFCAAGQAGRSGAGDAGLREFLENLYRNLKGRGI